MLSLKAGQNYNFLKIKRKKNHQKREHIVFQVALPLVIRSIARGENYCVISPFLK